MRYRSRQKQLFLGHVYRPPRRWGRSTVIPAVVLIRELCIIPIVEARLSMQTRIRVILILRAWSSVLCWRDMAISLRICPERHICGSTQRRAVGSKFLRPRLAEIFEGDGVLRDMACNLWPWPVVLVDAKACYIC